MQDSTDEELAVAAAAGDETAFASLFARHHVPLVRQSRRQLGGDWDAAEEIAQCTWIKAHQHLKNYNPQIRPFVSWLHTIRIRLVIDHNKAKAPAADTDYVVDEAAAEVDDHDSFDSLNQALGELPDDLAETIRVVYLEERSFPEAARYLGCSVSGVHKRSLRAIAALRQTMGVPYALPIRRPAGKRGAALSYQDIQMMVA
jgi:RNA polymerase sigma-70 factor (ECF subfamily)